VGFRWFTLEAARREGAMGWVRNLPDGRVEALLEGDAEAITRVERAIRSGPRGARVEQVDVDDQEVGGYRSFTIER
jgi:acylphosphatase